MPTFNLSKIERCDKLLSVYCFFSNIRVKFEFYILFDDNKYLQLTQIFIITDLMFKYTNSFWFLLNFGFKSHIYLTLYNMETNIDVNKLLIEIHISLSLYPSHLLQFTSILIDCFSNRMHYYYVYLNTDWTHLSKFIQNCILGCQMIVVIIVIA